MLSWVMDTVAGTLELLLHRIEQLQNLLDIDPPQQLIPTKTWQKIIGKLRSMALAIPGACGLFSLLQEAFRHKEQDRINLHVDSHVGTL